MLDITLNDYDNIASTRKSVYCDNTTLRRKSVYYGNRISIFSVVHLQY